MKLVILGVSLVAAGILTSTFLYHRSHAPMESLQRHIDVDFSKPITEKRLCVKQGTEKLYCTWVSHGVNSGGTYATSFSNQPGSKKSSLGEMKLGERYYGSHGLSYRIIGLEPGKNNNVLDRDIVLHGSDYIGYGHTGKSWGCLSVPNRDKAQLFKYFYTGMKINVHL